MTQAEVRYIEIDVEQVPYTFSIKLDDKTFRFTIRWNEVGRFFTVDLATAYGEPLCYGQPVRYGRPLFGVVEDERFPLAVIIPRCLTGDSFTEVASDTFGKEVKIYLFKRDCNDE